MCTLRSEEIYQTKTEIVMIFQYTATTDIIHNLYQNNNIILMSSTL